MSFDSIIEKLIREAQAQGKFDNLSGQGRPLALDQEDENAEDWAANRLLKNNGFRPAWLEEDIALREALEQARQACRRSWEWRQAELQSLPGELSEQQPRRAWVEAEWILAQDRFREAVAALNQRRRNLNLQVPSERFQRLLVDPELELRRLTQA